MSAEIMFIMGRIYIYVYVTIEWSANGREQIVNASRLDGRLLVLLAGWLVLMMA